MKAAAAVLAAVLAGLGCGSPPPGPLPFARELERIERELPLRRARADSTLEAFERLRRLVHYRDTVPRRW